MKTRKAEITDSNAKASFAAMQEFDKKEIEWNIDPIKRDEVDTGEVQIWADVPKETADMVVRAVNSHEALLEALKLAQRALTGPTTESAQKINQIINQIIVLAEAPSHA